MVTLKSNFIELENKFSDSEWNNIINQVRSTNSNLKDDEIISRAATLVLNQQFKEVLEKKMEYEAKYGPFVNYDVKVAKGKVNLESFYFVISIEYFDKKDLDLIPLLKVDYAFNPSPLSLQKQDEIARLLENVTYNQLPKNIASDIKKLYKQEMYANFYDLAVKQNLSKFDVMVSDNTLKTHLNSDEDIKQNAIAAKIAKEVGGITLANIQAYSYFIDMKSKIDKVNYLETNNNIIYNEWVVKAIQGRKLLSILFPQVFRTTIKW